MIAEGMNGLGFVGLFASLAWVMWVIIDITKGE